MIFKSILKFTYSSHAKDQMNCQIMKPSLEWLLTTYIFTCCSREWNADISVSVESVQHLRSDSQVGSLYLGLLDKEDKWTSLALKHKVDISIKVQQNRQKIKMTTWLIEYSQQFFSFGFWDRVLFVTLAVLGSVDKPGLELMEFLPQSHVLGLKACTTTPGWPSKF